MYLVCFALFFLAGTAADADASVQCTLLTSYDLTDRRHIGCCISKPLANMENNSLFMRYEQTTRREKESPRFSNVFSLKIATEFNLVSVCSLFVRVYWFHAAKQKKRASILFVCSQSIFSVFSFNIYCHSSRS